MGRWLGVLGGVAASIALVWAASAFPALETTWTEALGFALAAWWIALLVRQVHWNWLFAILSSLVYAYVFVEYRHFTNAGLQVVYVALSVYGWYWWLRGGDGQSGAPVVRASSRMWLGAGLFVLVATAGFTYLNLKVQGAIPFWDGLTTALSLAGQYLQARKVYENWHLWIVTNAIYVGLYLVRGLELTAVLSLALLGMCVLGLREWRPALSQTPTAS